MDKLNNTMLIDVLDITEDEANIVAAKSDTELVNYDKERKLATFKGSLGTLTNVALIDFHSESNGDLVDVNGDTEWFVDSFLDAQHKEIEIEFDDFYIDEEDDEEEIFELYKTKLGVNVRQLGEPYGPYLFYANTLGEIIAFIAVYNGDLELDLPKLRLNRFISKINRIYMAGEIIETKTNKKLNENLRGHYDDEILGRAFIEDVDIVLNYVFNTDEGGDQYGDTFLYEVVVWTDSNHYPITKQVYQTYEEMMNGEDYDINYKLRQALREAYPEYIIDYVELMGDLYDMTAIINCRNEDGDYIDIEVPVQIKEIEDTTFDDETRLSFWA